MSTASNNFIIKHFPKDVCYSSVGDYHFIPIQKINDSIFQENFVEKNTHFMTRKMIDIIRKSLDEFIDNDMLNQLNDSKSVTNCLRNDLGKLMKSLNGNVISIF